MNYRKYKEGDTVRITGCQGRLFSNFGDLSLNSGVSLGVECVLIGSEDDQHDVRFPMDSPQDARSFIVSFSTTKKSGF